MAEQAPREADSTLELEDSISIVEQLENDFNIAAVRDARWGIEDGQYLTSRPMGYDSHEQMIALMVGDDTTFVARIRGALESSAYPYKIYQPRDGFDLDSSEPATVVNTYLVDSMGYFHQKVEQNGRSLVQSADITTTQRLVRIVCEGELGIQEEKR